MTQFAEAAAPLTAQGRFSTALPLMQLNQRDPDDMLVAGYADQKISEKMTPPLTSIQLSYGGLGRLAVEYLCDVKDAATPLTLAGRLKIRHSTATNL